MGFRTYCPWHMGYCQLKEFEKMAEAGHVRGFLPACRGKEHPYLQRQKDVKENSDKQGWLFPPLYYAYLISLTSISTGLSPLHPTEHKNTQAELFPYEACHVS